MSSAPAHGDELDTQPLDDDGFPDEQRRPLATPDQIAAYLKVSKNTVYAWSSRGGGPRMSRVGRHLRARWEDLDAYLDANTVGAA